MFIRLTLGNFLDQIIYNSANEETMFIWNKLETLYMVKIWWEAIMHALEEEDTGILQTSASCLIWSKIWWKR